MGRDNIGRRLAAILSADVVGYSRLMGIDEVGTLDALRGHRAELIDPTIAAHQGRIVKLMGDGLLVEFASAIDAVECAAEIQQGMAVRNARVPDDRLISFRMGINLGEVIVEEDDIYGDGVNVASRLQEVAEQGGVYISSTVYEQVEGKVDIAFDDRGNQQFKNIAKPIRVYSVPLPDISSTVEPRPFFNVSKQKKEPTTGGCSCGAVRYEADEAPVDVGYCHCRMCQRFTGSAFAAFVCFPVKSFRFTKGEPKYYDSSPLVDRGFCADCGSSLAVKPKIAEWLDWIAVQIGTLDQPEKFSPTWHGGIESQNPWLNVHDNLPRVRTRDQPDVVEAWASVGLQVPEPNLR